MTGVAQQNEIILLAVHAVYFGVEECLLKGCCSIRFRLSCLDAKYQC